MGIDCLFFAGVVDAPNRPYSADPKLPKTDKRLAATTGSGVELKTTAWLVDDSATTTVTGSSGTATGSSTAATGAEATVIPCAARSFVMFWRASCIVSISKSPSMWVI